MDDHPLKDFVVEELIKHRSKDEIIMMLSERTGVSWKDAKKFVEQVEFEQRRRIAAGQLPLLLLIALVTAAAGLILFARAVLSLIDGEIPNPRVLLAAITGLTMLIGAAIGIYSILRRMG